ncbi:MAG: T9SS type A sorting domain-containing protein, partial [Verrucomicrobia bacterium]|nr:T9SS type A sorting domain-containing protein [Cytophagales bacterium]
LGKKIWEASNSNNQQTIDIKHEPAGMYLLKINTGKQIFIRKIIKY